MGQDNEMQQLSKAYDIVKNCCSKLDFLRNYLFFEKIKRTNQVKPQTRTFFRYNNNQTFTLFHSFVRSLLYRLLTWR